MKQTFDVMGRPLRAGQIVAHAAKAGDRCHLNVGRLESQGPGGQWTGRQLALVGGTWVEREPTKYHTNTFRMSTGHVFIIQEAPAGASFDEDE